VTNLFDLSGKIKGAIETRMRDILDARVPINTMPS